MLWHEGAIPEAINVAKERQALFVVFIVGDDEESQKMNSNLQNGAVSNKLCDISVALKLNSNSDSVKQFSQIYPVVVIPSTYFIGLNGVPLEVIGGSLDVEQLLEKVDKVIHLHRQQVQPKQLPPPQTDPAEALPTGPHQEISENVASTSTETSAAAAVIANDEAADCSSEVQQNNEDEVPLEARVERAKQLASQIREKKLADEEEKEKQKEIERRKLGKQLQIQKQRIQEQEVKQIADEIARERAEEKAARERIREQIAQDRAERAARYNAQKAEEEKRSQEIKQAKLKAEQERAAAETASRSLYARLQFRLPDGSAVNHQFDAGCSLQVVSDFVKETVKPPFHPFILSLAFPRREFQKNDYSQTLRDLQLAPSALILVLPIKHTLVQSSGGAGFSRYIWLLFSPMLALWRMLHTFLFGVAPTRQLQNQSQSSQSSSSSSSGSSSARPNSTFPTRRSPSGDSKSFGRRDGNIYRLPDADGSTEDDDNNTWNGNSTQQQ